MSAETSEEVEIRERSGCSTWSVFRRQALPSSSSPSSDPICRPEYMLEVGKVDCVVLGGDLGMICWSLNPSRFRLAIDCRHRNGKYSAGRSGHQAAEESGNPRRVFHQLIQRYSPGYCIEVTIQHPSFEVNLTPIRRWAGFGGEAGLHQPSE